MTKPVSGNTETKIQEKIFQPQVEDTEEGVQFYIPIEGGYLGQNFVNDQFVSSVNLRTGFEAAYRSSEFLASLGLFGSFRADTIGAIGGHVGVGPQVAIGAIFGNWELSFNVFYDVLTPVMSSELALENDDSLSSLGAGISLGADGYYGSLRVAIDNGFHLKGYNPNLLTAGTDTVTGVMVNFGYRFNLSTEEDAADESPDSLYLLTLQDHRDKVVSEIFSQVKEKEKKALKVADKLEVYAGKNSLSDVQKKRVARLQADYKTLEKDIKTLYQGAIGHWREMDSVKKELSADPKAQSQAEALIKEVRRTGSKMRTVKLALLEGSVRERVSAASKTLSKKKTTRLATSTPSRSKVDGDKLRVDKSQDKLTPETGQGKTSGLTLDGDPSKTKLKTSISSSASSAQSPQSGRGTSGSRSKLEVKPDSASKIPQPGKARVLPPKSGPKPKRFETAVKDKYKKNIRFSNRKVAKSKSGLP